MSAFAVNNKLKKPGATFQRLGWLYLDMNVDIICTIQSINGGFDRNII